MSHKDLCINWVERRKYHRMDGRWQESTKNGELAGEIYDTEEELEDALWEKIIGLGIGDLQ